MADTACFFAIAHQGGQALWRRFLLPSASCGAGFLLPSASADGLKGFRGKASSFVGFNPFY